MKLEFKYILEGPDKQKIEAVGMKDYTEKFNALRAKFPKGVLKIRAELVKEKERESSWARW